MGTGLDRFEWFKAHVLDGTLDEDAVREGFAPKFLEAVPAEQLVQVATGLKATLALPEVDRRDMHSEFLVSYGEVVATGAVEIEAPHRFRGLLFRNATPEPLQDERLDNPPLVADGVAPVDALRAAYVEHGLIGVVAAAFSADGAGVVWRAACGYSNLEDATPCTLDTRMLAGSISKLFIATAALQLVAAGSLDLDAPANSYLQSLRVASDAVTVRQLLTHTAGVSSAFNHFVKEVPPPSELLGDVVALDFEPGTQRVYSNGGYTVLGEVISGVAGTGIVEHLETKVLAPLGMVDSSFATRWPDDVGPGYEAKDGRAEPMRMLVPSVPAAGGLVTTTRDLGRFVAGWRSMLPADLVAQALSPQVPIPAGGSQGFGWIVGAGAVGHAGGTLGHTSSLLWRANGTVNVLMTNRVVAAQAINVALQA